MRLLSARTFAEACIYIEMQGAAGNRIDFASHLTVEPDNDGDGSILQFDREQDGRKFHFAFRVAPTPPDAPEELRYGHSSEPSALVDAGQWLGLELSNATAARNAIVAAADGIMDQDTFEFVVETLAVAAAAADEQAKFLPPDGDQVPASAVWSQDGREIYEQYPELLRRERIQAAGEEYRQALVSAGKVTAVSPESATAEQPPRLLARSSNEARLYIELHPCLCGTPSVPSSSSVVSRDGNLAYVYEGSCPNCGRPREFAFRIPDDMTEVPPNSWSNLDTPSELLDAGEWRWIADVLGSAPTDEGLSGEDHQRAYENCSSAASAIDEALLFVSPGSDAVPDSAFWTVRGREIRQQEPGRFQRFRLEAARSAYRQLAEEHARQAGATSWPTADPPTTKPKDRVPADSAATRSARTISEVDVYLAMHPCQCDAAVVSTELDTVEDGQVRYTATCDSCGRQQFFLLAKPPPGTRRADNTYAFDGAPASTLVDAGEWLLLARTFADAATVAEEAADPEQTWRDEDAWEWMDSTLNNAVSAVDEVLRFLPDGATELPDTAFWSEVGLQVWREVRPEFSAERLRELRETSAQRLWMFRRENPDPFEEIDLDALPPRQSGPDADKTGTEREGTA